MTQTQRSIVPRLFRWLLILLVVLLVLLLIAGAVLAALPVESDPTIPEEEWGAGAVNIEPAWTGLQREWPELEVAFNQEEAELGYQLFFDPVLSGDDSRSCATCHHPDWGFSEPVAISTMPDGSDAQRHTPSLWNVAYTERFFWDGRAETLEEQVLISLASDMELDTDLEAVIADLQEIEAYVEAFGAIYDDGITPENVASAIAAFERTLVSDGAAFDAYAAGDFEALTAQQRRGLGLFRSAGTRCFECHMSPLFTDNLFEVTGVGDGSDLGFGTVQDGGDFAFKNPSLRNVALHPPYMHDGSLETLEEVIDHYANVAPEFTLAEVDRRVAGGFDLSEQEIADLVAFMFALTDESIPEAYQVVNYVNEDGTIALPTEVPSGMDVVSAMENPNRERYEEISAAPVERPTCEREEGSTTIIVEEGESIQAAVDCAVRGDTILVAPGVYHERIIIDQSGITLRGMVDEPEMCPVMNEDKMFPTGDDAPNWPILDGEGVLTDGVIASGNDFTMEYFHVRNYTGNGILVEGVNGVTLRHLFTEDTGLYGVYPVHSTEVLVECSIATQIFDAGIYVGQSRRIIVRNNLAYDNITGIEIENSYSASVYNNEVWNNTGGMLIFLLPNITSRISSGIDVYDNYIHDNNRPKGEARPGSIVALVPVGTGMFIMATDNSEFRNNVIENNDSFGIALVSLYQAYSPEEILNGVGALSEGNRIFDNTYINNGTNPSPEVTDTGLPGADILWDATGYGNTFDESGVSMFPPILPSAGQPEPIQRAIYQLWTILSGL